MEITRSLNNNPGEWDKNSVDKVRIAALNIARLLPHMEDLKIDPTLLKADIIHLCETWVSQDIDGAGVLELEGYVSNFVSMGNGRGLVSYSKGDFQHDQDVREQDYQITKFRGTTADSIHVYRYLIT